MGKILQDQLQKDNLLAVNGAASDQEADFLGTPYKATTYHLIGGFGAGSDLMWDANINLGYRWTSGFSTTIGYRHFEVEYEDDTFLYDVVRTGPMLGLSWKF